MNNSINNSVNFQAKLDVSGIKRNRARWENIAKKFEQQTKYYSKDKFILEEYNSGVYFERTDKDNKILGSGDSSFIHMSLFDKLEQLEDSKLVEKLKKLFILQRKYDSLCDDARNFLNKYVFKSNVPEKTDDKFGEIWITAEEALIERHLKNDKFLYKNREHLDIY